MFSENRSLIFFSHWSTAVSCTVPGIVDTDGKTEGRKKGGMERGKERDRGGVVREGGERKDSSL